MTMLRTGGGIDADCSGTASGCKRWPCEGLIGLTPQAARANTAANANAAAMLCRPGGFARSVGCRTAAVLRTLRSMGKG